MFLSYPDYNGCQNSAEYVCPVCPEGEAGRVRALAFVRRDVRFVNPSDPLEWLFYVYFKQATVIPSVRGSYDGGKETTGEGFGSQQTRVTGVIHTLEYEEPMTPDNVPFYNSARRQSDLAVYYLTEKNLWITDVAAKISATKPVEAGIDTQNVFKVNVQWSNMDFAVPHEPPPGIFESCARLQELLAAYCPPCRDEQTGVYECAPCPSGFGAWATFVAK